MPVRHGIILDMAAPRVTVVMPSYNAQRFISEAIDSVIQQTLADWELLVVDDGSTDSTPRLVRCYQRLDHRITLITVRVNRGPAYARNLALRQAQGDFVAFIDSDDVWLPGKLQQQVHEIELHKADISYTAYRRRRDRDRTGQIVSVPPSVTYHTMLRRNYIACSTAMIRRSTCQMISMPNIARRQDHGYWLALLRDGSRTTIGIPLPLTSYRLHSTSLSANKIVAARYSWRLLRQLEGFSFLRSLWYFSGYALAAIRMRIMLRSH